MLRKVLVFGFAFIAAVGLAYFASSFLFRVQKKPTNPGVNPVRGREKVDVPVVRFTDITKDTGITFRHVNGATGAKLLPETMGGGVAVFDYDGDGKPDILFVQSGVLPGHGVTGPVPTLALYRNLGNNKFQDVTAEVGLNVPMYGMGVCVGDIDNDGRPDIFVSCVGKHHLFRNVDGKRFEELKDAGVSGEIELPWKESRDEFLNHSDPIPFGSSCTFVDYDGDGKLDLFVCHYITWSPRIDRNVSATLVGVGRAYVPPKDFNGTQCKLYRNTDGRHFEDVSKEAGIEVTDSEGIGPNARTRAVGKSLGVILCDPDEDGWPDLMIANDSVRNFFFHNVAGANGKRHFVECGKDCNVAYADDGVPRGGMGIDYGEFRSGLFAAIIANFANEASTFFRQAPSVPGEPKEPRFSDTALTYGLAGPSRPPLKFGAFFFDYDLDGRLDLLTCNGHIEPEINKAQSGQQYPQPAQLFWNTGLDRPVFEPATEASAGKDLFQPIVGRGSAFADLDGDGDLDVVLCSNNGPPIILRNDCNLKHHWLRLHLVGDGKTSNRSAIGATVIVEAGGKKMTRTVAGARGYLSQSEFPITLGLAATDKVDRVLVKWPGKEMMEEEFAVAGVDRMLELKQGAGKPAR
jgi:hypothetical protein